jgi:hypothetical protein
MNMARFQSVDGNYTRILRNAVSKQSASTSLSHFAIISRNGRWTKEKSKEVHIRIDPKAHSAAVTQVGRGKAGGTSASGRTQIKTQEEDRARRNLMPLFSRKKKSVSTERSNVWARPEMLVTFKAEIMPGRSREQRTFRIKQVLSNGRIILYDFIGEHRQGAFEPINFLREKAAKGHQT